MNKKKIIIGILFVGILFFLFGRKKPAKIFKTQKVEKGRIGTEVSSSGAVRSETEIKVQFQTSGKLTWLGVKEGDLVKKGQALASLDKEELKKKFTKTMNDYLTSRWDFEQKKEDYKFEEDHALITDSIRRILDKSQYSLNKSVLDVEIANLALKYATIYSPIEGVVTKVDPPVAGLNLIYSTSAIEIADPNKMRFEAIVDETDIGRLKVGQPAIVTLDAFPEKEFKGKIERIAFKSTSTSSGGTGFSVDVFFPLEATEKLRIGLNGDFRVVIETKENVLLIPSESLLEIGEGKYVFKFVEGRVIQTEVTTGLTNEELVEIVKGLSEGDLVIQEDAGLLKDGQKVVVR